MALTAVALVVLLALMLIALRIMLRPDNASALILRQAGAALGLQITATGPAELQLRGTPRLVLRGLDAREAGSRTSILRASRITLVVPWKTLRSRGALLDIQQIALDAPVLDLLAMQAWMAKRPSGNTRIPTLDGPLTIRDGRIDNDDWRIEGIHVDLPNLHPGKPVNAQLRGRYLDTPLAIDFDLAVALTQPANDAGAAVVGHITIAQEGWRLPARIRLSGPVHLGDDELHITPARLAMSARYESGETRLPFVLGLYGPVHFDEGTWTLAPAGIALRGEGVLPTFVAHGALALGRRLVLRLDGQLPRWNAAWPALPAPIGGSDSPLPFRLDYVGKSDTSDVSSLLLARDDTRFEGRFRLPVLLDWVAAAQTGSPLPPLDGRLTTPRVEVAGAQLEGVEVILDDPDVAPAPPASTQ